MRATHAYIRAQLLFHSRGEALDDAVDVREAADDDDDDLSLERRRRQ